MTKDYTTELMGQCSSKGIAIYSVSIHWSQNVCIIDIVLLLSLLSFSICCNSQYQCYWYYYIPFFIAIIIDKLSGNLKEYPSFKGKYSIFLSCTYEKF